MSVFKNIPLTVKFISGIAAVNNEKGAYHRQVQKAAAKEITKSREIGTRSLTPLHYLKIQWYMATTLFLGELLCVLRTNKLSQNEKLSLIYLGALIAITDMMVDDFRINRDKLTRLMTEEKERSRKDLSAIEQILLLYYRQLLTVISEEKKKTIHDFSLLKPQVDSQEQLSGAMTEKEIMEQTRKKGGTALLLVASLLFDINNKNKDAFYQLGYFIQLMNDSQDLPKDIRNGVTTLIPFQKTYKDISSVLHKEFHETARLFYESEFPQYSVYRLLFNFHAMLTGIGFKLVRYAAITNGVIDPALIKSTDKSRFRIKMFSPQAIAYCLPKIISYNDTAG
jgi:hypothetical protein